MFWFDFNGKRLYFTDINAADKDGKTPLIYAAEARDIYFISRLLKLGADPNAAGKDGKTPLIYAAEAGEAYAVQMLLALGALPNTADVYGSTPLMYAAQAKNTDPAQMSLKSQALLNAAEEFGFTPLMYKTDAGNNDAVQMLLTFGADPNAADIDGITPLMYAAEAGNTYVMWTLLERGADRNAAGKDGKTPLMYAASSGNSDSVQMLLVSGAHPNTADKRLKTTPLMYAASSGNSDSVQMLLTFGANIYDVDDYGSTPLMYAAEAGNIHVIKTLTEYGADINARDRNGFTTLTTAASTKNIGVIVKILELGADPNSVDMFGNTALIYTVGKGDVEEITKLLEAGADTSLFSLYGHHALTSARNQESENLIKSAMIAWKIAIGEELSEDETHFYNSADYNQELAIAHIKGRLTQIALKDLRQQSLSTQEEKCFSYASGAEPLPEKQEREEEPDATLNKPKAPKIIDAMENPQGNLVEYKPEYTYFSSMKKVKAVRGADGRLTKVDSEPVTKVFTMHIAEYDNPILNHPETLELLKAAKKYQAVNPLFDLTKDKEVAKIILEEIDAQGADKVMEIIFGKNQPNDDKLFKAIDHDKEVAKPILKEIQNQGADKLFKAIDRNDIAEVMKLISKNFTLVNAINADGNSALFMAYVYGNSNIANYLVENGAVAHEHVQETNNIMEMLDFIPQIHPDDFEAVKAMNRIEEGIEDSFNSLHLAGLLTMLMYFYDS